MTSPTLGFLPPRVTHDPQQRRCLWRLDTDSGMAMRDEHNRTCTIGRDDILGTSRPRDIRLQVYFSLALGLWAFLTFCFLRPRWKGLYAARKKQNHLATALPDLPDSFFGWIIPLWRITDEQVLASAGLDAYVYLAFFKMAIKFLLVTLFFALAVIKPVHDTHQDKEGKKPPVHHEPSHDRIEARSTFSVMAAEYERYTDYLWMYLVFVYLFTALILYLIVSETRRIIEIRQEYLGSQTTITDRTIRLSGIPVDLRSEDKIKDFIMDLGIGQVESVTLCRDWKELDNKVIERQSILRKVEEAWTVHLGHRRVERSLETLPVVQPRPQEPTGDESNGDSETTHFLSGAERDPDYIAPYAQQRPTARIWYGRFKLRYKNVDAIDYYEEKLRKIDDEIRTLRKKDFEPMPLAFVTMDSVASAQMAIQAVLDPSPLQLLANSSPAPSDVVWSNTYLTRTQRIFRSWSITIAIGILSVFWTVLLLPIAGTASGFYAMLERFAEQLSSATEIAHALATSLSRLLGFYTNFILLQGFGIFPFRLLEFGALSLYPVYLIGAKTPRDYAELVQPPTFSYGFFLPQTILIFIICMVYSVLENSWQVLLTGLAYFMVGHYVHKYQLLYAMEHRQHSTGKGWTMMCDRVIVGVVLFQITVAGQLALKKAFKRAALVAPLAVGTLWFLFIFARTYRPLMKFIALKSLRRPEQSDLGRDVQEESFANGQEGRLVMGRLTLDEARERGLRFENPSLIMPLNKIYLSRGVADTKSEPALPVHDFDPLQPAPYLEPSTARRSSFSPPRFRNEPMSQLQEYAATTPLLAETIAQEESHQQSTAPSHTKDTHSSLPKRSEVLRHVFPRPSRSRAYTRKPVTRVAKVERAERAFLSRPQSKSKVAFHKYITAFFGGAPDRHIAMASPEARSRASSFESKPASSLHGSIPSLDLVTPATFVFSGPSLRSAESHSDSMSRFPSLAETGSEVQLLQRARTDSLSMLDDARVVEDAILEPNISQGITRTVSDVLLGISTSSEDGEEEEAHLFSGTQQAITGLYPTTAVNSDEGYKKDSTNSKALSLANRAWYMALCVAAPPRFQKSYHLPVEILQHIYDYLGPKDFNAARHSCRDWMRASLDKNLLITMLNRGGWMSSVDQSNLAAHAAAMGPDITTVSPSPEWSLSRRLSRECTLASCWTGNGLDIRAAFVKSAEIDYTELTDGFANGLVFATSLCSRFLCIARETLVFIYDLEGGHPVPITSVVCPRRVLAMSMDVSSGRHAIAALLEGRMGIVCELRYGVVAGRKSSAGSITEGNGQQASDLDSASIHTNRAIEHQLDLGGRTLSGQYRPFIQERDCASFNVIDVRSNNETVSLQNTDDDRTYSHHCINRAWNLDLRGFSRMPTAQTSCDPNSCAHSIPIESRTSTIYRHLCSEDDPPRSVSICPQRLCVAFGCSAGIELHWIDALTAQSLSRWFPLTAPSDYLHFLPPRPGYESAKKLRLISSAAHPGDRPAIASKLFGRPSLSAFWGSFGFESASHRPGSPGCDHYHAVPLSDGHHILFIDPSSDRLALGCDAPLGGPTKLLRKVLFVPPEQNATPKLYSAAADLSQGIRVAVTYGDIIMVYSIPPDVCRLSRLEEKAKSWCEYNPPTNSTSSRHRDHWLN
ncbi:DUF221-domain-containing protein [Stemphylium lycopersici]|uniref:DUF221-domain-containing protein n=1 Tax=Stemphylium lycopersici TaxID=183478 RepID=A0A364N685_STELY|nr:DUF221-domain-containing protein [Stemphylium lycopersici]